MRMLAMVWLICTVWVAVSSSLAVAAPKIPAGEAAGRQRERFVDPPIARFFQPGTPGPPLLTIEPDCRPRATRTSKQKRSKRRQAC
jgi:hypothetical protein